MFATEKCTDRGSLSNHQLRRLGPATLPWYKFRKGREKRGHWKGREKRGPLLFNPCHSNGGGGE